MADTPDRIVVRLDVRGTDEEWKRLFRHMARARAQQPVPRRPWWRRLLRARRRRR